MSDRKLVTDEEIGKGAFGWGRRFHNDMSRADDYERGYRDGARWCRDRYEPEIAKRDALLREAGSRLTWLLAVYSDVIRQSPRRDVPEMISGAKDTTARIRALLGEEEEGE